MPSYPVQRPPHRGSILLAVLVLVSVMTIGGLAYFNWTNTERRASAAFLRQAQARAAAASGAEFLRVYLREDRQTLEQSGGLYSNPDRFAAVLLQDSDAAPLRVRFSVIAPDLSSLGSYEGFRFGLEDESGRINLNTILLADNYVEDGARQMLAGLPGVTDSIADAILDWIDEDDEPRPFGAESSYYSSLTPAYGAANRPPDAIEQLLLVRGITETLLYGRDRDQNLAIDSRESQRTLASGVDGSDGSGDRGLAAYLTLFSAERNAASDGTERIDVNQDDLETLHDELTQAMGTEVANFVVAFRQGGAQPAGQSGQGVPADQIEIDFDTPANEKISSLLSLIGVSARVTPKDGEQEVSVESPFPDQPGEMISYLPELMGNLTVSSDPVIPGRVNVNQAPRVVLEGVPGMPPEAVNLILSSRNLDGRGSQSGREHGTWLLAEGLVDLEAMRELEPLVCGGGDVFRAQVVGFYDEGGVAARHEVVVDATGELPVLRRVKGLTPLGGGRSASELGVPSSVVP